MEMRNKEIGYENPEKINRENIQNAVDTLISLLKPQTDSKEEVALLRTTMTKKEGSLKFSVINKLKEMESILNGLTKNADSAENKSKIIEKNLRKILELMLKQEMDEPKANNGKPAKTKKEFYDRSLAAKLSKLKNMRNGSELNQYSELNQTLVQLNEALKREIEFLSTSKQTTKESELAA